MTVPCVTDPATIAKTTPAPKSHDSSVRNNPTLAEPAVVQLHAAQGEMGRRKELKEGRLKKWLTGPGWPTQAGS